MGEVFLRASRGLPVLLQLSAWAEPLWKDPENERHA
jgi:hypothetical protein